MYRKDVEKKSSAVVYMPIWNMKLKAVFACTVIMMTKKQHGNFVGNILHEV